MEEETIIDPPDSKEEKNEEKMEETPDDENQSEEKHFQCNICFNKAQEPVITQCGHLYCWPCIFRWLNNETTINTFCPVCRAGISRNKLIPVYGRGGDSADTTQDPVIEEEEIPERPQGQRDTPQRNPNYRPPITNPFQNIFGNIGFPMNQQRGAQHFRHYSLRFQRNFPFVRFVDNSPNNQGTNNNNNGQNNNGDMSRTELYVRKKLRVALVCAIFFIIFLMVV